MSQGVSTPSPGKKPSTKKTNKTNKIIKTPVLTPVLTDAQTKEISDIIKNTLKDLLLPLEHRIKYLEENLQSSPESYDIKHLEKRLNNLEDNISDTNDHLKKLENNLNVNISGVRNYIELLSRKVDDNNQYARRMNLVIHGISVQRNESPDSLRQKVITELNRLGLRDAISNLDRAHRYGYRAGQKQAVIVRFNTWHARNLLYDNRKQCTWNLTADLTDRRHNLLNAVSSEVFNDPLMAYAAVDRNCTLYAMSTSGKSINFSSLEEYTLARNAIKDDCKRLSQYYDFLRVSEFLRANEPDCSCNSCKASVSKFGKYSNKSTQVININDEFFKTENTSLNKCKDIIYIGRRSKWGNQFTGEDCIKKFEENLPSSGLLNDLKELKGKILACFCKPGPCHGDVLARLADGV